VSWVGERVMHPSVLLICRDVRRGRAVLLGLTVLIGLAGAVVMTAAAGARRTGSSLDRIVRHTLAADVVVNPDGDVDAAAWAAVDALPQVELAVAGRGFVAAPVGEDGWPDVHWAVEGISVVDVNGELFRGIERSALVAGRYADLQQANEMVVTETLSRRHGVSVGDRLRLVFYDHEEFMDAIARPGGPPPSGVEVTMTVTAVVLPLDDAVRASDDPELLPQAYFTPALMDVIGDLTPNFEAKQVRLHDPAQLPAFESAVRGLLPKLVINFQELDRTRGRAERAVRPFTLALWLFAALAAGTAVVVVGQTIARSQHLVASDTPTLAALGFTRSDLLRHAVLRGALVGGAGALVAAGLAVLASPLMPMGPLRRIDPSAGVHVDVVVLGLGALLIVVVAIVGALVGMRRFDGGAVSRGPRLRLSVPVPLLIGTRFAIDRGRGAAAVPLRSTLLGTTVAIAAVSGTLVYGAGLSEFTNDPVRYGWPWDFQVALDGIPARVAERRLERHPDVAAAALGRYGQLGIAGRTVAAIGLDVSTGLRPLPLLDGRMANANNEVVLGATTLNELGLSISDTVQIDAADDVRTFTIVGTAVFPRFAPYQASEPTGLGVGAALTLDGLAAIGDSGQSFVLVQRRDDSDISAAELGDDLFGGDPTRGEVLGPQRPNDVLSYDQLQRTPYILAAILVLLGAATAVHLLVSSVRRRRHDLAMLKSFGCTRNQLTTVVLTQSLLLAGIALVIGLPLGIVAGRWLWIATARWLGIAESIELPAGTLLLVVACTLLTAGVVAVVPGRAAARLPAAAVLTRQ
jgi:putative ABC transport system permease protein